MIFKKQTRSEGLGGSLLIFNFLTYSCCKLFNYLIGFDLVVRGVAKISVLEDVPRGYDIISQLMSSLLTVILKRGC